MGCAEAIEFMHSIYSYFYSLQQRMMAHVKYREF